MCDMKNMIYRISLIAAGLLLAFACTDPDIDPTPQEPDNSGQTEQEKQPVLPDSGFKSQFQRHMALWEFTGAWCANCPSGYTNMNFVLSTNPDFANVHPMAFHSNSNDEDDLAVPDTDQIMQAMNVLELGFPSYVVDMALGGSLVEGVNLTDHLYEMKDEYPCFCGVAVTSELNDGMADVKVRLTSELDAVWRVGVYVVEDKVKYYQKDGMKEHDAYTHRHVVRRIVSASYRGDRIGGQLTAAGTEVQAEYDIEVDSEWNLDNTCIYVLAIDSRGYVNNVNFCAIDGGADYNRI